MFTARVNCWRSCDHPFQLLCQLSKAQRKLWPIMYESAVVIIAFLEAWYSLSSRHAFNAADKLCMAPQQTHQHLKHVQDLQNLYNDTQAS